MLSKHNIVRPESSVSIWVGLSGLSGLMGFLFVFFILQYITLPDHYRWGTLLLAIALPMMGLEYYRYREQPYKISFEDRSSVKERVMWKIRGIIPILILWILILSIYSKIITQYFLSFIDASIIFSPLIIIYVIYYLFRQKESDWAPTTLMMLG